MKTLLRCVIAIAIYVLSTGSACSSPTKPSAGPVTYSIIGTAKHVSITFQSSSNGTSQLDAAVPWTFVWTAQPGDFLYCSAQIDTSPDPGSITVNITKSSDGKVNYSATASGFPNIATASGSK